MASERREKSWRNASEKLTQTTKRKDVERARTYACGCCVWPVGRNRRERSREQSIVYGLWSIVYSLQSIVDSLQSVVYRKDGDDTDDQPWRCQGFDCATNRNAHHCATNGTHKKRLRERHSMRGAAVQHPERKGM